MENSLHLVPVGKLVLYEYDLQSTPLFSQAILQRLWEKAISMETLSTGIATELVSRQPPSVFDGVITIVKHIPYKILPDPFTIVVPVLNNEHCNDDGLN